jgi:DNA-binding response OmpR family regulator
MKGKILIVSDDPLLVKMLEIRFTQEDFVTYSLHDGREVTEKIHQIKPDMIIADIMMPCMDGHELRRCLKKDPAAAFIPFIILSSKTNPSDQLEGFRMGADDYICKPFELEDLIIRVKRVIRRAVKAGFFDIRADLSGNLAQMKLVDIIQLIELNHKTGELIFKNQKGKPIGKAFFKEGNLINAHMGLLSGEAAFYGLMGRKKGYFEFSGTPVDVSQAITLPNMSVLLNGSRLIDEAPLEVQKGFTDPKAQMDKGLFLKIQEINMQKLSGVLEIKNGSLKSSIYFHNGEIIHAVCGMHSGQKALFRILSKTVRELNFSYESLSEIRSIQNPIHKLLIDATREIEGLKMFDKTILKSTISIKADRLNQISKKYNHQELNWIIELVKKHERIGDILEASRYTDLKTFKAILELNNLKVIDISKN